MANDNSTCRAALEQFVARDFRNWQGLPQTCELSEVARYLNASTEDYAPGRLGEEGARYTVGQVAAYSEPVRIWFRDERVVLLEVQYPEIEPGVLTLVKDFGEPATKLTFYWYSLVLEQSQWVYPERGLALFINPENQILLHLTVFTPTKLEDYEESLLLSLQTIPL